MKTMILIPSLAPGKDLITYVHKLAKLGIGKILVVNDGSGEQYQDIFDAIEKLENCVLLTHNKNLGKGEALKTGFRFFLNMEEISEYKGIISADSDGQHQIEDILKLSEALEDRSELILGVRNFYQKDVPSKSRFGNCLTRNIFKLLYKVNISDTQTGLRGFPKCLLPQLLNCGGSRYEYETNMLILCAQKKIEIKEVPIQTIYLNGNASSHFNPVKDSFRIYRLFFGTFVRFLLSSASSAAVDLLFFTILIHCFFQVDTTHIFLATIMARIVSSILNFILNRKLVFSNHNRVAAEIVKYYMLAAVQMMCSAALVSLLSILLPSIPTVNKVIVDTCLFFCSFTIQKKWIFQEDNTVG